MRHATLRQLKVFESVARLLSFSRAAEELHLTQPAVSTQVNKLEEHAGVALFEQFGKRIHLMAAGAELLQVGRTIMAQFETAEAAMAQFGGIVGGRLNVGVISAGGYFIPRLLVEFAGRHPGVTFNFTVHNREELLSHISQNLTELAIMVRPPADLDTVNLPFAPRPCAIVAAADHPLAGVRGFPLATVMREAFVVREKGSDTWHSMEQGLGAHLAQWRIALAIKSTETIKQAVIAGIGVSFLSAHTIAKGLHAGRLCVLDVEHSPLMLDWYVVYHRGKRLTPVAQAFRVLLIPDDASLVEDSIAAHPAARIDCRRRRSAQPAGKPLRVPDWRVTRMLSARTLGLMEHPAWPPLAASPSHRRAPRAQPA